MKKKVIYQEINQLNEEPDSELSKKVGGFSWHTEAANASNAAYGLQNEIANGDIGGFFGARLYNASQSMHGHVASGLWDLFNGYCSDTDGNHAKAAAEFQNAAGELSYLINGWGESNHALSWELIGTAYEAAGAEYAACGNYAMAQQDFHNAASNFASIINIVGNRSCESWDNMGHAYALEAHAYEAEGNNSAAANDFNNAATNYSAEVNIGGNHSASVFNDIGSAYADEGQCVLNMGEKSQAARDYYLAANNYGDAGNTAAQDDCINKIRKIG